MTFTLGGAYLLAASAFIGCFLVMAFWGLLWVLRPRRHADRFARWIVRTATALGLLWVTYQILPTEVS